MLLANKDQRKLSTAIFSSMKPNGEEERMEAPTNEEGTPIDSSVALESCAEDLAAALERKDTKAIVAVFKDLFYLLQDEMAEKPESEQA